MGDHPVQGAAHGKPKCAQSPKKEYQWLHDKTGCALVPDKFDPITEVKQPW